MLNETRDARIVKFEICPRTRGERPSERLDSHSLAIARLLYFTYFGGIPHSFRKNVRIRPRKWKAKLKSLEGIAFDLGWHQVGLPVREIISATSATGTH